MWQLLEIMVSGLALTMASKFRLQSQLTCIQTPVKALTGCMTLGKLFCLSTGHILICKRRTMMHSCSLSLNKCLLRILFYAEPGAMPVCNGLYICL